MIETPKLRTPLVSLLGSAWFFSFWYWKITPVWLTALFGLVAMVIGFVGLMSMLDWIVYRATERARQINQARLWPAISLAGAIKGLTTMQTEAVLRQVGDALIMVPDEQGTILFVRCLTKDIPWEVVAEYLESSVESEPYLKAIRNSPHEEMIQDFTRLLISKGWAEKNIGPYPARLRKPLKWVAERFWVDLELDGKA